jgi:hypothetical protein
MCYYLHSTKEYSGISAKALARTRNSSRQNDDDVTLALYFMKINQLAMCYSVI